MKPRTFPNPINISFRTDRDFMAEVMEVAKIEGVAQSEIIRRAVALYMEDIKRDSPNGKLA